MDEAERTSRLTELRALVDATPGSEVLRLGAQVVARRSMTDRPDDDDPRSTLDPDESEGVAQLFATFEAVFLVAAADGELVRGEVDALATMLAEITGREIPGEEISRVIDECAEMLDRDDYGARAASVAARLTDPASRRAAFVMAVGVAFVDGALVDEERDVFGVLARAFGISDDEARTIVTATRRRLDPVRDQNV